MTLENWLPADRQRHTKPAAPPTEAQQRLRLKRAKILCQNAANATSKAMADRLVIAWLGCGCDELMKDEA